MRVRSKLLINTITTVICLASIGGIGFYYINHVANTSSLLFNLEAKPILKINSLETIAWEKWLSLIEHSGISDYTVMQKLEIDIVELDKKIVTHLFEIESIYALNKQEAANHIKTLNKFKANWQKFQQIAEQILAFSQNFTKEDALNLIVKDGKITYKKAINNLRDLVKQHHENMQALNEEALNVRWEAINMIKILVGLLILISLVISIFVIRQILTQVGGEPDEIANITKQVAAGNLNIKFEAGTATGIYADIQVMVKNLKVVIADIIAVSKGLASGNLNVMPAAEYKGNFLQIEIALQKATIELTNATKQNAAQNWIKNGQSQLNDKIRGEQYITELTKNIITFLTNYIEVQVGVFYLLDKEQSLRITASYGYIEKQTTITKLKIGEGLVGQAALECKTILRTHKPEECVTVNQSTLTKAVLRHIIIMPFLYEDELKGVIEIGSVDSFSETQQNFLETVMPNIGIAVNTASSRSKMQQLLKQSQQQAEELQTQQEELQKSNEELQTQTEELQTQQEELRQTNEVLEERTKDLEQQKKEIQNKNQALEINRIEMKKTQVEMEKTQAAITIKAEELEIASKYKSEFLANMSHELRTPLNSLLILSQLLAENNKGNLDNKQIEYANTINSAGNDLLILINDILDLSKVEAGKIEMQLEAVSLTKLITSIEQKFAPIANEKKIKFNIKIANNIPSSLQTDSQRIKQIINNLLSNAFKFTSEGTVSLMVQYPNEIPSNIEGLELHKTIAIIVIDTGIGIPLEKQKIVFEAFQQADGSTNRRYGGTGLGLSISRQLARLLGGELALTSEFEKGSTFTLYLPAISSDKISPAPVLEEPLLLVNKHHPHQEVLVHDDRNNLSITDMTILIVEDDRKFSNIIVNLAKDNGFKCLLAEDGIKGLKLAEEYRPSAIILDIGLPKLDGLTLMRKLKDNNNTRHIPVYFISAANQSIDAKKMGAIGYLVKPINTDKLQEAFEKIKTFLTKTVKTLLIIADNKVTQNKIMNLVVDGNLQVEISTTSEDACKKLLTTIYDCVILDMDLEHGSGNKLLEKMQQEQVQPCKVPIIIYVVRELTKEEETLLLKYSKDIPIKYVTSPERLVDEATLFLHQIEANLPNNKRKMLHLVHDKKTILKHKKVLIIDDDERNIFALATILENHDVEVVCGVNGKEGLEMLAQHDDVEIVLMDIMMPEMDGYETIQEIRKQKKYNKLPIIALTAKAMKDDKAKCIEAGANDYLAKPVDTDKLLSLMRVWLYK